MVIKIKLLNKNFDDSFAVSVNGETKELSTQENAADFEIGNSPEIELKIKHVRHEIHSIKNPFEKFFACLLLSLISLLRFFADNDNGIGIHKFFYNAKPFDLTKTYKIKPSNETVLLKYIPAKYNKSQKCFSAPDIELFKAETTEESLSYDYNCSSFKSEFRLYHYPGYSFLFFIIALISTLTVYCLIKQLSPFNLAGVIAISFCIAVILALLIVFIVLLVFTHRLFRQINCNLTNKYM